ncbi:MAG TPA: sigma-70 family RNA polymerase sigma factor, partial [Nocardioides sp.]|nr:sigma-70 family RNA polymerase sigma factor [Nocardioides sp.]
TDAATAEDVLAETLLVCWRRVEDLPADPLPWAYAVARNCLRNAERATRRQERVAARIASVDPPREDALETDAGPHGGRDGDDRVREALARLRPADAELLRLWAWEGLEPAALAVVLGITANAAGVRLHRARARLAEELGKTGQAGGHEQSREGRRS